MRGKLVSEAWKLVSQASKPIFQASKPARKPRKPAADPGKPTRTPWELGSKPWSPPCQPRFAVRYRIEAIPCCRDEEPEMSLHDPLIRKLMTRQDLTRAESADLM